MQSKVATKSSETDSPFKSVGSKVPGVLSVAEWDEQCVNVSFLWFITGILYHIMEVCVDLGWFLPYYKVI